MTDWITEEWEQFIEFPNTDDKSSVSSGSALLFAKHVVAMEREAAAKIADNQADDLASRMQDADWREEVTGSQVVNGYRMISKLIRARRKDRAT